MDANETNGHNHEMPGGLGGGPRDTRMVERAIRQRWPLRDEYREPLVNGLLTIAVNPANGARERVSASRALIAMEGQNQADEHKQLPDLHAHLHMDPAALERY